MLPVFPSTVLLPAIGTPILTHDCHLTYRTLVWALILDGQLVLLFLQIGRAVVGAPSLGAFVHDKPVRLLARLCRSLLPQ
jgi:hypothetical protein